MSLLSQKSKTAYTLAILPAAFSFFLIIISLFGASTALASQMELEVIELRHRPAQELVPILKPFVTKGGSITGTDYKLIVRSTPQNIDELRKLLNDLDTALRQMKIYVSTDYEAISAEREIAVQGRIASDPIDIKSDENGKSIVIDSGREVEGGASSVKLHSSRSISREPSAQTIRVTEGQWANIQTGQAVPVTEQTTNPDGTITRTIRYHTVSSGFQVRPQISGDQVLLFIRPQRASINRSGDGQYDVSGLQTTVKAKLGEWVELGGTMQQMQSRSTGIASSGQASGQQYQQVFVKIELEP
jgi:type II secretory pathway component GspD/PulD (secretin)